jgi:hypothetical protein
LQGGSSNDLSSEISCRWRMPPHAFEDRMEAQPAKMKCVFALKSIAPGYRVGSIRGGYQTDWATAFQRRTNPVSDGPSARLAGVICHSS